MAKICKAYIVETDGIFAKVIASQGEVFDDVLLIFPYGFQSRVKPSDSTLVLLFGSQTNLFAIPYDIASQTILEEGEAEIRNRVSGLGFKAKQATNEINGETLFDNTCDATAYKVSGMKVVGNQEPTIANPAGGLIIDAESRLAISSIITALKNHGLIA